MNAPESGARALTIAMCENEVCGADTMDPRGILYLLEDLEALEAKGWRFVPPPEVDAPEGAAK